MATKYKLVVSTQRQVLTALKFLYQYILDKPLNGKIQLRPPKKQDALSIVLSIKECLCLRVRDIDFSNKQIHIIDKGVITCCR